MVCKTLMNEVNTDYTSKLRKFLLLIYTSLSNESTNMGSWNRPHWTPDLEMKLHFVYAQIWYLQRHWKQSWQHSTLRETNVLLCNATLGSPSPCKDLFTTSVTNLYTYSPLWKLFQLMVVQTFTQVMVSCVVYVSNRTWKKSNPINACITCFVSSPERNKMVCPLLYVWHTAWKMRTITCIIVKPNLHWNLHVHA